jgi:hypothetical protein
MSSRFSVYEGGRNLLLTVLRRIRGMKALVMDPITAANVSSISTKSEMSSLEVFLTMYLSHLSAIDPASSAGALLHLQGVIVTSPDDPRAIAAIERELDPSQTPQQRFADIHLCFTSPASRELLERLARADSGSRVASVQEVYAGAVAVYNPCTFVIPSPAASLADAPLISSGSAQQPLPAPAGSEEAPTSVILPSERRRRVAAALAGAVLGLLPETGPNDPRPTLSVRYSAAFAESTRPVAEAAAAAIYSALGVGSAGPSGSHGTAVDASGSLHAFKKRPAAGAAAAPMPLEVVVLDRRMDPLAPLVTPWSFQSLVTELTSLPDATVAADGARTKVRIPSDVGMSLRDVSFSWAGNPLLRRLGVAHTSTALEALAEAVKMQSAHRAAAAALKGADLTAVRAYLDTMPSAVTEGPTVSELSEVAQYVFRCADASGLISTAADAQALVAPLDSASNKALGSSGRQDVGISVGAGAGSKDAGGMAAIIGNATGAASDVTAIIQLARTRSKELLAVLLAEDPAVAPKSAEMEAIAAQQARARAHLDVSAESPKQAAAAGLMDKFVRAKPGKAYLLRYRGAPALSSPHGAALIASSAEAAVGPALARLPPALRLVLSFALYFEGRYFSQPSVWAGSAKDAATPSFSLLSASAQRELGKAIDKLVADMLKVAERDLCVPRSLTKLVPLFRAYASETGCAVGGGFGSGQVDWARLVRESPPALGGGFDFKAVASKARAAISRVVVDDPTEAGSTVSASTGAGAGAAAAAKGMFGRARQAAETMRKDKELARFYRHEPRVLAVANAALTGSLPEVAFPALRSPDHQRPYFSSTHARDARPDRRVVVFFVGGVSPVEAAAVYNANRRLGGGMAPEAEAEGLVAPAHLSGQQDARSRARSESSLSGARLDDNTLRFSGSEVPRIVVGGDALITGAELWVHATATSS